MMDKGGKSAYHMLLNEHVENVTWNRWPSMDGSGMDGAALFLRGLLCEHCGQDLVKETDW